MDDKVARQLLSQVQSDYDTIAEHFAHTRMNQWYEVSYLTDQYIQPGQLVLDLGCGNGRVADLVGQIKARYIGMDVSPKLIEIARRTRPGVDFRVGDMLHTGLPDDMFDCVLMIASLHHIPSQEKRIEALKEAKRLVKDSGFIVMTNWNLHQFRYLPLRWKFNMRNLFGKHTMDWNDVLIPWYDDKRHMLANRYYHAFTMREMRHIAKKAGLHVDQQYHETNGLHVPRHKGQNLVTILTPLG